MKRILWLALLISGLAHAQQINPAAQSAWPRITGAGAPIIACTSANYGQPYQNTAVTPNTVYTCGTDGWAIRGAVSGPPAFSAVTPGTNTNPLAIGTGGSLEVSGTGTINANVLAGNGVTNGVPGPLGTGSLATGTCIGLGISAATGTTSTSVVTASLSATAAILAAAVPTGIVITPYLASDTHLAGAQVCNHSATSWTYTGFVVNFQVH